VKVHLTRHYQQVHQLSGPSDELPRPIMKTRAAFLVRTSPSAKLARIHLPELVSLRHLAKNPFIQLSIQQIKQEIQAKLSNGESPVQPKFKKINRGHVVEVANKLTRKLGLPLHDKCPEWLITSLKKEKSQSDRLGNFTVPNINLIRTHEQNELDNHTQPLNRRALVAPVMNNLKNENGKQINGRLERTLLENDKNKFISCWEDKPDGLFISTEATKKLRQQVQTSLAKRLRRSPCNKNVIVDFPPNYDASKL